MLPTPDSDASHAGLGQNTGYIEPSLLSLEEVDGFLSHIDSPGHPYFHAHTSHSQARTSYSQVPGKILRSSSNFVSKLEISMDVSGYTFYCSNFFNYLVTILVLAFLYDEPKLRIRLVNI